MVEPNEIRGLRGGLWCTGAFFLNMPLALLFAALHAEPDSWPGIIAAVLLLWLLGLTVCVRPTRFGPVMVEGSLWVAWSQIFPVLQVVSGALAILPLEMMGVTQSTWGGVQGSFVWGFLVTFLSAQPLLLAAFVLGGGLHMLREPPATEQTADYG